MAIWEVVLLSSLADGHSILIPGFGLDCLLRLHSILVSVEAGTAMRLAISDIAPVITPGVLETSVYVAGPGVLEHGLEEIVELIHFMPPVTPEILEQVMGSHWDNLVKKHRIIAFFLGLSR